MTVTAPTHEADVAAYLDQVAAHMAHIPAAERDDLLDDLAQHLAEVAAEDGPPLAERLGSPADYAAELLASAGFIAEAPPPTAAHRARAALRRIPATAAYRATAAFLPQLRPAWWVLRGYLAAMFVSEIASDPGRRVRWLITPQPQGNEFVGAALLVACVVLSVMLGRRQLGRAAGALVAAGGVALLLFGVQQLDAVSNRLTRPTVVYQNANSLRDLCLNDSRNQPIQNIYPFDAEGRPLENVLLYDQDGRPIDNLCPRRVDRNGNMVQTEYARDANGRTIVNVFPRKRVVVDSQPDPGTTPTTALEKPPAIVSPRLGTTTTTTSTTTP